MSSFAKNNRGSRVDPRLLFGNEREHLPTSAMGEDAVDPRRRRDNDRGYDRDGPPPSRAEENGWSRVSQPPAPGIRLTQGDPDGESSGGPPVDVSTHHQCVVARAVATTTTGTATIAAVATTIPALAETIAAATGVGAMVVRDDRYGPSRATAAAMTVVATAAIGSTSARAIRGPRWQPRV